MEWQNDAKEYGSYETISSMDDSRILTPIQAYELALDTLRNFEDKWNSYIQEEARLSNVFDGEIK